MRRCARRTLGEVVVDGGVHVDVVDASVGGVVVGLELEARVKVVPDEFVLEHKVRSGSG